MAVQTVIRVDLTKKFDSVLSKDWKQVRKQTYIHRLGKAQWTQEQQALKAQGRCLPAVLGNSARAQ